MRPNAPKTMVRWSHTMSAHHRSSSLHSWCYNLGLKHTVNGISFSIFFFFLTYSFCCIKFNPQFFSFISQLAVVPLRNLASSFRITLAPP
ncbi:hypothetical protein K445DRAFT_281601 [Daldinia sp. EC12]|nr:hypothetical protein K445DRAFT_281601 [Daldinia sp. EC12]